MQHINKELDVFSVDELINGRKVIFIMEVGRLVATISSMFDGSKNCFDVNKG